MELDQSNLIQIFSFESRIVKKLLENIDPSKHNKMYPLFYKMQQSKGKDKKIKTAVEIALEGN
jgi:hypothetical protein